MVKAEQRSPFWCDTCGVINPNCGHQPQARMVPADAEPGMRPRCVGYPSPFQPARHCPYHGWTHFPTKDQAGARGREAWEAEAP
jgi:hypothetical protein